ncbi:MAG: alpha/beta hydrolase [Planctomycetaceae bacterium]|nr:alpha/beta hydrolase [Planctomycetaceae bacterium]MCB9949528.1 alpha/beta hydrolase [Planctomycetaceae bacterium]
MSSQNTVAQTFLSVKSRFSRLMLTTCFVTMCVGCRVPKVGMFFDPPEKVLVYDTAQEREIAGQDTPPEDSLAYDYRWRYRNSLAEAVAVRQWDQDAGSVWRVLFATNRQPDTSSLSQQVEFTNTVDAQPHFGSCSVALSHQEPEIEEPDNVVLATALSVLPGEWQKEVSYDQSKYAAVDDKQLLSSDLFFGELRQQVARSRQHDVLLFVHGFNVDFDSAAIRLAQIAKDLPFNGAIVAYSWPSQGGVGAYSADGQVVQQSIPAFKQFLTELTKQLPADTRINIVVHSMGNRLVLRTLAELDESPHPRFQHVVFCAPDVGVEEFKEKSPLAIKHCRHATLYTCMNDAALIASAKVNHEERAGGSLVPTIVPGIDTVECAVIDTSLMGHSYYGSNKFILRDLFAILKEDQPADERKWLKPHKVPFHGMQYIFGDYPVDLQWVWHYDNTQSGVQLTDYFEAAAPAETP